MTRTILSIIIKSIFKHAICYYAEPASIDESYHDMTGAPVFYHLSPRELADNIRERVCREISITISVGVPFNKVFTKMGSDYKKPDATTVITEDNFKEILWPLPVSDLLFAGRASVEALNKKSIRTIRNFRFPDKVPL